MRIRIWVFVSLFLSIHAQAYDNKVAHRAMTRLAFEKAATSSDFLKQLGLSSDERVAGKRLREWASDGAHDEDERMFKAVVQFHFYDPENQAPLTVFAPTMFGSCTPGGAAVFTARQWALEPVGNEAGLRAAKQHLVAGLAGRTKEFREKELAASFEALGHVMHLVQDMAQPQHTRDDLHLTLEDSWISFAQKIVERTWSRFEKWCALNLDPVQVGDAYYASYPLVRLSDYGDYFSTGEGLGLAEYSNRNFVTEHTNYSDKKCSPFDHDLPFLANATPRQETHTVTMSQWDAETATLVVTTGRYDDTVYSFPTYDKYLEQTATNANHTFYSFFDYELKQKSGERVYSLPESAFRSQADLLVPRAVGYSAGLLDHFFRGKIDVTWSKDVVGLWKMSMTNRSSQAIGSSAFLQAYYVPGSGYLEEPTNDAAPIVEGPLSRYLPAGRAELEAGETVVVDNLDPPGLHPGDAVTQFERRIVITGPLGNEPDAVIGLVQQPASGLRGEITFACGFGVQGLGVRDDDFHFVSVGGAAPFAEEFCGIDNYPYPPNLPNACISKPVGRNAQPVVFRLSVFDPAKRYSVFVYGFVPNCTFTTTFFLDGKQTKTESKTILGVDPGFMTIATWP